MSRHPILSAWLAAALLAAGPALADDRFPLSKLAETVPALQTPDFSVQGVIGRKAFVATPEADLTIYEGDFVRYRGALYSLRFAGRSLLFVPLQGQDAFRVPVGRR